MYGGFDLLDHSLLVPDNIHSQKRKAAVNYKFYRTLLFLKNEKKVVKATHEFSTFQPQ